MRLAEPVFCGQCHFADVAQYSPLDVLPPRAFQVSVTKLPPAPGVEQGHGGVKDTETHSPKDHVACLQSR